MEWDPRADLEEEIRPPVFFSAQKNATPRVAAADETRRPGAAPRSTTRSVSARERDAPVSFPPRAPRASPDAFHFPLLH